MGKNAAIILLGIGVLISIYIIKNNNNKIGQTLKTFQALENSLSKSNENIYWYKQNILAALYKLSRYNPNEAGPFYGRALEARNISMKFITYIENLKRILIGKKPIEEWECFRKTEDFAEHDFITKPIYLDKKSSITLMNKTVTLRKVFLELLNNGNGIYVNQTDINEIDSKPYFKNCTNIMDLNNNSTMEESIVKLTKLQNDALNFETDIISTLSKYLDYTKCHFDRMEAKIIPNVLRVKIGSEFRAEVFLEFSKSFIDNSVIVNGKALPMDDGKGIYTIKPSKPGIYFLEGFILVKTPTGSLEFPFKQKYEVYK